MDPVAVEAPLAIYDSSGDTIRLRARAAEKEPSGHDVVDALENLARSEDDSRFPTFGTAYSPGSNYPQGVPERVGFGQARAPKDGMLLVE